MLQHSGKVFFRVSTIDREEGRNPKVYLDIFERDSQRLIGLKTSMISPTNGGAQMLEDIVVGGILWVMKDNHYTYPFVPNVYMVVHSYEQDEPIMKDINDKIVEILAKVGAKHDKSMMRISCNDVDLEYVKRIINRY